MAVRGDIRQTPGRAVEFLGPVQERYRAIAGAPGELERVLETGAQRAQKSASEMLELVYERIGFLPRRR